MTANNTNPKKIRKTSAGAAMLVKLREGTKHERVCQWPGNEAFEFVLVPLHADELQEALAGASKRFDSLGITVNLYSSDDWYSEINIQVLARAMRDITDETRKTKLFTDAAEFRSVVTPDERNAITTDYLSLQAEANPDRIGEDVFEQIEELVKKKDALALAAFPSSTLATFLTIMGDRSLN